jgi:hypothetical protein
MLLLSPAYLAIAALALGAIQLVRCLSSPLRRLPGPNVSLFTSLVLKWKEIGAARTLHVHALHEKYGPVVRIAPNEVSFTSWPALKEIYCSGGSGYEKSDFYNLFKIYGRRFGFASYQETLWGHILTCLRRTMFTTLNKADVSRERSTREIAKFR